MKLVRIIFALVVALVLGSQAHAQLTSNSSMSAPMLNPPNGANNYLPITNPTWNGSGAGTTLNLTNAPPSLFFNGTPMGGTCTGVQVVNAISSTGIPSCVTPAGSGGGPPLPISIANGGTGGSTAPAVGNILVASSTTLFAPVAMSGNATISSTGALTITSLPSGLTIASPTITNPTITGTLTLPAGSVTDANLANAYSGVGACAAGSVATTLNRNAAPTCSTMTSLGSGIWLPVNNPTYTGTMTGPTLSLTNAASSSILWPHGSISEVGSNSVPDLEIHAGGYYNGTHYVATSSQAQGIEFFASTMTFTVTAGLTPGNNYGPTTVASLNYQGFNLPAGEIYQINGAPMGGTCAAGSFVSTISSAVIPTCTSPGAGTFAPYTNPAGGQQNYAPLASPTFTGTVVLPASTVTDAMLANAYSGVGACAAGSVATTLVRNAAPTCSTIASLGGGTFAPLVNPASGQNNYAPLANPTFTGTATIPTLSVTGSSTFSGVATFNSTAAFPYGATVSGSSNLYVQSPAAFEAPDGGSWTSTGITTNKVSVPAGGSISFPDASTYTNAGHNSMKALGVGVAAPAVSGSPNSVLVAGNVVVNGTPGGIIPSDAVPGHVFNSFVTAVGATPGQSVDAGVYYAGPPTNNYKVSDNAGNLIHTAMNPDGHEYGIFLANGLTNGSSWSGTRSNYLAFRDALAGSGAGLFLESGIFQVMGSNGSGGLLVGGPTGGNKGTGTINAGAYYVQGNQLTRSVSGVMTTMGGASATFTLSSSMYVCSMVCDGIGGSHCSATCDINVSWNGVTGQNGGVVNIGYLPWVAASGTATNNWFVASTTVGISYPSGCQMDGVLNAGQSWITLSYHGPSAICGSGAWLPDTSIAASGNITYHGTFLIQ